MNRYVTVVNPVRGANLWKSKESVQKQIALMATNKLPSTWLLQYDVLSDDTALNLFEGLSENQDIGILLEVSENLATDADVAYLFGDGDWARADKVLLSGYSPLERERMLDMTFEKFKNKFGFYPTSVGAWYIDTLSLDYLVKKYHIQAVMYVSDQYQTDSYGLWGQPWGAPYYPSKFNSLIPAHDLTDRLDVVKIQWAARDPVRGYGLTAADSIYSVQANDYMGNNLGINYFKKLSQTYLFSLNSLAQLTVGIETGQEGATFFDEYKRQIQFLSDLEKDGQITFQTMSAFAQKYKQQFAGVSPSSLIYSDDYADALKQAIWYSNSNYRIGLIKKGQNLVVQDLRVYPPLFIFEDIFQKDTNHKLRRFIPSRIDEVADKNEKVILSNIDKIKVVRDGENVILSVLGSDKKEHKILLAENNVIIDGKEFFSISNQHNDVKLFFAGKLMDYWREKFHGWMGSWRYSSINGQLYFGFMPAPNTLIGLNTKFPFIGIFIMPFQVLIRFKTFPEFNIDKTISNNLVKRLNNSTIKIETH